MRVRRVSAFLGTAFVVGVGAIGLVVSIEHGRPEVAQPEISASLPPPPSDSLVDPEELAAFQAANRAAAGLPSPEEFERMTPAEQELVRAKLPPPPVLAP